MNYRRHSKTCQFEEDPLAKSAKVRGKIIQEVLLILKFLKNNQRLKVWYYIFMICIIPLIKI